MHNNNLPTSPVRNNLSTTLIDTNYANPLPNNPNTSIDDIARYQPHPCMHAHSFPGDEAIKKQLK